MRRARTFALFAALLALAVYVSDWDRSSLLYGALAFGLLSVKGLAAVTSPKPAEVTAQTLDRTVAVVVTVYNEDPAALRACVAGLLEQWNVDRVVLVDDGSTDGSTVECVQGLVGGRVVLLTQPNAGKRHALRAGVRLAMRLGSEPDFVLTIDSDTVPGPGSVAALVAEMGERPFAAAVTGVVRAHNWDRNWLTRAQDIRYAGSFLWERAAYSRLGSVLCVCGAFTLWRAGTLERLVDDLVEQTFLGEECTFGDDRHLTNLALREGWEIRLCESAYAGTLVPERAAHWVRQQVRWSKSFIRETVWAVGHLPVGSAWWLAVLELMTTLLFSVMLGVSLAVIVSAHGAAAVSGLTLWLVVMSWARSVRWLEFRAGEARWVDVVAAVVLAPAYGLVHLVLVVPMRFYALATLRRTAWGTRKRIEVAV